MFQIDFSVYFCYYLSGLLVAGFLLWFWSTPLTEAKALAAQENIWQCPVCLYVYFDAAGVDISACPQCGSFNKKAAKQGGDR